MSFTIGNKKIGRNYKPFLIAELSANHNGCIEKAFESILSAKENGADAIKMQTYRAETMTIDSNKDDFMIKGGLWDGYKLFDLYKEAETPFEWFPELFEYARKISFPLFSTPFDETAVDLLESLNAPAYKIASFELIDLPLIKYVARLGKPMLMSTGLASLKEVQEAVVTAKDAGCKNIILLHCISSYPAPIEEANLRQINKLAECFDVEVGLSDHTLGITASIASVALGAVVIEKHFKIDDKDDGPDSEFSINPEQLKQLSDGINDCWKSLGTKEFKRQKCEDKNIVFRRSIYVVKDLKKGDVLNEENIRRIRPGYGLPPKYFDQVIGKKILNDLKKGTPLSYKYIE